MQHVKAFTLVELMMVVVLIGMISVFAIPNYTNAIKKTNEKAAANNLLILYSAQMLRKNSGGDYQAGADAAALNTNLSLGIIANGGTTYSCAVTGAPPTAFTCKAIYAGSFGLGGISETSNTLCCCSGYVCATKPTLSTCASCP